MSMRRIKKSANSRSSFKQLSIYTTTAPVPNLNLIEGTLLANRMPKVLPEMRKRKFRVTEQIAT